jgi:hypothetical protein
MSKLFTNYCSIADGQRIAVYRNGHPGTLEGTSSSALDFASIINRIIEERIKVGKGPIGLINPVLYEHPEVLNDITYANFLNVLIRRSADHSCSKGGQ